MDVIRAAEERHFRRRGLNDLGCLGAADLAGVRLAIATVADDVHTARSREVDVPPHGSAAAA